MDLTISVCFALTDQNLCFLLADVHGDPDIKRYPPEPPPPEAGADAPDPDAPSPDFDMLTLDIPRQQILIGAR